MKIGILALQGSFAEHQKVLESLKSEFVLVRLREDLENLTHLIIPGGESTTMMKLLKDSGMWEEIQNKVNKKELKIMGTCAGAILCSYLGMNIEVDRNGYGAQLDSFSEELESDEFKNLRGVFIRAPRFKKIGKEVRTLATCHGEPVLVEQGNFLALAFHPEISGDTRIHEYFLKS